MEILRQRNQAKKLTTNYMKNAQRESITQLKMQYKQVEQEKLDLINANR